MKLFLLQYPFLWLTALVGHGAARVEVPVVDLCAALCEVVLDADLGTSFAHSLGLCFYYSGWAMEKHNFVTRDIEN